MHFPYLQRNTNQSKVPFLASNQQKRRPPAGILSEDKVKITKSPVPIKFDTLYSEETAYREFNYTPNLQRPISIIDPETTEEIKPVLFFDEKTNEVKGKCKLKPYKSYFAFEIREKN